jgi:hypothetical protein
MKRFMVLAVIIATVFTLTTGFSQKASAASGSGGPILADYAGELREAAPRADGIRHFDTPAMIQKLKELHVNTYYYLVWHESTDWDDLKNEFLPAAQAAGIQVNVYLVPPTESTGTNKSYPYKTDYIAWAKAIAELSLQYPNLVGWTIDDFDHNLNFYTPAYMAQMKAAAKSVNPKLSFTPQMYTVSLTESFLQTRGEYIDGMVLAYRDDPYRNTMVWSSEQAQIDTASALLGKYNLPLVWMLYASILSSTPASPSAEYVRETVQIALDNIRSGKLDGVVTYVLKKDNAPESYDKNAFSGSGYLSFFVPAGTPTQPGYAVFASQTIRPDASGQYSISFRTMDEGPNVAGYHAKQLLVDGTVVWEQDIAQNTVNGQWESVQLDLTPYLTGKSEAVLTFRMIEKKGVSNFWNIIGFDAVESAGFALANGDFEDKSAWELTRTHPTMLGDILIYDPDRSLHAFNAVKASYLTYDLYNRIGTADINPGIRNSLMVKAVSVLEDYFAERSADAEQKLIPLSNEIQALAGMQIPEADAELWLDITEQLDVLY